MYGVERGDGRMVTCTAQGSCPKLGVDLNDGMKLKIS